MLNVEVYLPPMDGEKEMRVAIWVPLKKEYTPTGALR